MQVDSLFLLPVIFGFSIFIALFIYWVSGKVSAKGKKSNNDHEKEKTSPYACGEDLPPEELKINLERFFVFAIYFLIFDVLAFILAISFNTPGYLPVVYSLVMLIAVAMLLSSRRLR